MYFERYARGRPDEFKTFVSLTKSQIETVVGPCQYGNLFETLFVSSHANFARTVSFQKATFLLHVDPVRLYRVLELLSNDTADKAYRLRGTTSKIIGPYR